MNITIEQVLDIYDELYLAMKGEQINDFENGNIAEIFIFTILPHSPVYSMQRDCGNFDKQNDLLEKKAAESLHSLCYVFSQKHKVEINIKIDINSNNRIDLHEWIKKIRNEEIHFSHRVYIEVIK